jgi:hypothetical protein
MSNASVIRQELAALSAELASNGDQHGTEERLRRIEDAIAAMQDQQAIEERLLERLLNRVSPGAAAGSRLPEVDPHPVPLPPASHQPSHQPSQPVALLESVIPDTPASKLVKTAVYARQQASGWLIVDMLRDLYDIGRMYFDNRYRVSRNAKVVPMVVLIVMMLSYLYFTFMVPLPIINTICDKILNVFLILYLYRYLSREAERYRNTIAMYP